MSYNLRLISPDKFCGAYIPKERILAGGAIERPIAFENNDRPGIMLASALRTYAQSLFCNS